MHLDSLADGVSLSHNFKKKVRSVSQMLDGQIWYQNAAQLGISRWLASRGAHSCTTRSFWPSVWTKILCEDSYEEFRHSTHCNYKRWLLRVIQLARSLQYSWIRLMATPHGCTSPVSLILTDFNFPRIYVGTSRRVYCIICLHEWNEMK